jgi:hypothetical protein
LIQILKIDAFVFLHDLAPKAILERFQAVQLQTRQAADDLARLVSNNDGLDLFQECFAPLRIGYGCVRASRDEASVGRGRREVGTAAAVAD